MSESQSVRCADCGLLAAKNPHTGDYLEVDKFARKDGQLYGVLSGSHCPLCLVGEHDLQNELLQLIQANVDSPSRILSIVGRDRDCTSFCKWRQGFTPKEHFEMVQTELLKQEIEQRRIADEKRAEERRAADEERAEKRRVADEQRAESRRLEDRREAEQRRDSDRAWQIKQEKAKFWRGVYQAVSIVVLAAIIALMLEPWKGKPDPQPPQIVVNITPDVLKK